MIGFVYENVNYSTSLRTRLINCIETYLKADKNGRFHTEVDVKQQRWGLGITNFTARNIRGRVTDKYHEIVFLHLTIIPITEQKKAGTKTNQSKAAHQEKADIAVNFDVFFTSEPLSANFEKYENAIRRYTKNLSSFGAGLKGLVKTTIDGK